MNIRLKRIYQPAAGDDGCRILVERLWPRGVSKEVAAIEFWARESAPSNGLRKWFGHEPEKWQEFKRRYFVELDQRSEAIAQIHAYLEQGTVTFVFASKEVQFNNAVALKEYVEGAFNDLYNNKRMQPTSDPSGVGPEG